MFKDLLASPEVHSILSNVTLAVLTLLGTLLARLVNSGVQYVITKVKSEHNALYGAIAERLVKFAEQKFAGALGPEKARYVAAELSKRFPSLDPAEIDHIMEAAVLNLKNQLAAVEPTVTVSEAPAPK